MGRAQCFGRRAPVSLEITPARLAAAHFAVRKAIEKVFPEADPSVEVASLVPLVLGLEFARVTPRPANPIEIQMMATRLAQTMMGAAELGWQDNENALFGP